MKHSFSRMIFKELIYAYSIQVKNLCSYKLVRPTKCPEKIHQGIQKESHKVAKTIYLEEKWNICVIYYVFKWMKSFWWTVSFFRFYLFLSHCFSLLSALLSSKPFRNNYMHCEIFDRYFNNFLVEIQLKKKTWKLFFGARVRAPKHAYWSSKRPEYVTACNIFGTLVYLKPDTYSKLSQRFKMECFCQNILKLKLFFQSTLP